MGLFGFIDTPERFETTIGTAASQGFASHWIPQTFGLDTLTTIAALGRAIPDIRMATAVVPTYPRHPMVLAQQALTTNALVDGRLVLGVGPSHKPVVEHSWGISFDRPIRHLREYLEALVEAVTTQKPRYRGETITARGDLVIPDAPPPPVMVAALGPQLLRLTGRVADGTITWMVGPETLRTLTVPVINEAASAAGRPAPEVVAGVPVCVTDDVVGTRERAQRSFALYGKMPSYRAMLDREGFEGPGDVAILGDHDGVGEQILRYRELGVTTFAASEFGGADDRAATRELLVSLIDRAA
jgi:F420-dependent oxidoreductase-like protein